MTTLVQFEQLKSAGYNTIPVYCQRLADTETPLSVFARFKEQKQAYLFESVEGGENWARYSMIGLGESIVFSCSSSTIFSSIISNAFLVNVPPPNLSFVNVIFPTKKRAQIT
jgi:anthranilate/para-aminobenzoate synthase component I